MDLRLLSASQLAQDIQLGASSAQDAVEAALDAIEKRDGEINAFVRVFTEDARKRATEIDKKRANGEPIGTLAGVPIAIKDNIAINGQLTTCASRMLENFVCPYDATVITKLRDADAILIGQTNLDEFGMGATSESSLFGPTLNPHNPAYVAGGSSAGSAAAVAAGMVPAALGSDTGGSVRLPSSYCGTVGLKPTYGRVSRYGLFGVASSMDHVGTIAANVADAALLLQVIAGADPSDSTTAASDVPDFREGIEDGPKALKIGVPKEYFGDELDAEIHAHVRALIDALANEGAEIIEISLPHLKYAIATYHLIAAGEVSSNFARYDGVNFGYRAENARDLLDMYQRSRAEGFGDEVKRRILLGTFAMSTGKYGEYFDKAQRVRTLIIDDFRTAFAQVDAIITPTAPTAAFRVGEAANNPLATYTQDLYTVSANLAGIPGVSMPAGMNTANLPFGVQVLGPQFGESVVLRIARAIEVLR